MLSAILLFFAIVSLLILLLFMGLLIVDTILTNQHTSSSLYEVHEQHTLYIWIGILSLVSSILFSLAYYINL